MKILNVIDDHDYEEGWPICHREAVRAIIYNGQKIALVISEKEGYYTFPGGGVEPHETHVQTLIRETREETGLQVIPESIHDFGTVIEKRKSIYGKAEIFEQYSYYYLAKAKETITASCLETYEEELGYRLAFIDLQLAYETNRQRQEDDEGSFLAREVFIMKRLLERESM